MQPTPTRTTVLAFDVGKRDLSYCLFSVDVLAGQITDLDIKQWRIMDIRPQNSGQIKWKLVEQSLCVDNLCRISMTDDLFNNALRQADMIGIETQYRNQQMFALSHAIQCCVRFVNERDPVIPLLYVSAKGKFDDAKYLGFKLRHDTSYKACRAKVPRPTQYQVRKMIKENSISIAEQVLEQFDDDNCSWAFQLRTCKRCVVDDYSDSLLVGLSALCRKRIVTKPLPLPTPLLAHTDKLKPGTSDVDDGDALSVPQTR